MTVKRGDIYYADLSPVVGSEQGGVRPVLIVQNDVGNRFSPTVIAAAITSRRYKAELPTHIHVDAQGCGLSKDSVVLEDSASLTAKLEFMKAFELAGVAGWEISLAAPYVWDIITQYY